MTKVSVSKLVASGTKTATGAASAVVGKAEKIVVGVAGKTQKAVDMVASTGVKATSKTIGTAKGLVNKTTGTVIKANSKLSGFCNPNNIIPCVTALTIIAYMVVVTPATVLDVFSTCPGKVASLLVVLVTLLFDLKMGILIGLAVVLSISMASVNRDLYESFSQNIPGFSDSSGAPFDSSGIPFDSSGVPINGRVRGPPVAIPPRGRTVSAPGAATRAAPKLTVAAPPAASTKKPNLEGTDDHLASYAPV
uniref:Uncharacterized protein n=1 Tax=viral metagenome TaxID=1070528 RepID=A0A6C0AWT3_9ZZZZ